MAKYSTQEKLEAVLAYLEGKASYKTIAEERNMITAPLKRWVLRYQKHGEEGISSSYTKHEILFKIDVLNYMNEYGASINETAARFNLSSEYTVLKWKRQFEVGGIDALISKKKGRPSIHERRYKETNSV